MHGCDLRQRKVVLACPLTPRALLRTSCASMCKRLPGRLTHLVLVGEHPLFVGINADSRVADWEG
ncbi:hypothetical protein SBD_0393 [Streptomyces bottropensis ATCC 25435]|uniref:Uncharacterized protein n=1 Tax=Streptomyces bottropensis ATCC 25435 TaxID=1054862 RepID=M3EMP4_9ACTN|nr:hypothetical protein SBD_0393 [Streptomyces bottropensis ATCC 25435]